MLIILALVPYKYNGAIMNYMTNKHKIVYTLLSVAVIAAFWGISTHSKALSQLGWDYNLTKRCVKSVNPQEQNYFEDTAQCGTSLKHWTVAIQSEQTLGGSCPGPVNQSFLINDPGSPVTMGWLPHTDEFGRNNWTVNMKTDFGSIAHPCGAGYFTWFMFMDHVDNNGGPLPRPDKTTFSTTLNFNDFVPNGATRGSALYQGYWNGKSQLVELTFQGLNWGDNYPNDPLVFDTKTTPEMNFVAIDGKAIGIEIPRLQDTYMAVPWHQIIQTLITKGYLQAPVGGWQNSATSAIGIGHEVHNFSPDNSVIADLWFTNFRVESL